MNKIGTRFARALGMQRRSCSATPCGWRITGRGAAHEGRRYSDVPRLRRLLVVAGLLLAAIPAVALGDTFSGYRLVHQFDLPDGAGPFDALADGRLIALVGTDVYLETAPRASEFALHGSLPSADFPSWGAAFLRVSPDGTKFAVGNNGGALYDNYQVGVFDVVTLAGDWFSANHYDAAWIDNDRIALTAGVFGSPSVVTVLDTTSADPANPVNTTVIGGIGGASGGVAFDAVGNLFTGNGYTLDGPSGTGATKAFAYASWTAALGGGPVLDFETEGTLVVDILSGWPLGFDVEGNLFVGGGDFASATDFDHVALIRASAVGGALSGGGPVDPEDPIAVRRLDPDESNDYNFYTAVFNSELGRLCIRDSSTAQVHVYIDITEVPAVSEWGCLVMALLLASAGTVMLRGRAAEPRLRLARTAAGVVALALLSPHAMAQSAFATKVMEYAPAPGQWVNDSTFNDPERALGAPVGGGVYNGGNLSVVSLGGFGGYITLGFDHTVRDDPLNPFGMDAIVFSNAFWVGGNPQRHWAECATIEISLDANGNGEADDQWVLIPGSHIGEPAGQFEAVTWDDDIGDDTYPPDDEEWIPSGDAGIWDTEGYALPLAIFGADIVVNPGGASNVEGVHGYGEYSPTLLLGDVDADDAVEAPGMEPEDFYTVPDDPHTVGITRGSGGGDAFDIAWAIDVGTGLPAELPGFDFIRLTTAVDVFSEGAVLQKSSEIDAVADVTPDPFGDFDADGDMDLFDVAALQVCFAENVTQGLGGAEECDRFDRQPDGYIELDDAAAVAERMTGPR